MLFQPSQSFGECILIVEMHQDEHGGGTCDDFQLNKGNLRNSLALLTQ
jgi:hypothetical protein